MSFYAKNWIINQKEEVWRVFLTRTTASLIETGLDLLGIQTVEKCNAIIYMNENIRVYDCPAG